MKIRENTSEQIFIVYGVYWHGNKTYFYCFPRNSVGISSFDEDEIEIVDRTIDSDFEYVRTDERISGIFHKSLLKDQLMDGLLEHDPTAYNKFVSLIGKEP
jgi:hypothetical protein